MFQHHDGSSFEGVSMLGIVNALRTGDVVVDMIIAMCLPIILRMVFERLGRLDDIWTWKIWKWLFNGMSREHERFISHSTTHDQWGNRMNSDEDSQNSILLKAIKLYLHKVVKLDLRSTHLDLTELRDANCDIHDDEDDEFQEDEFGNRPHVPTSLASQLTRYTILSSLPKDEWHEIGTFGGGKVSLTIEHNNRTESNGTDQSGSGNNNTNTRSIEDTTFHFSSPTKGSIDCFVNAAYQWYLDELRKAEDNSRYYYEMKIPEVKFGKSSDDNGGSITYKRYRLSDEKSFDSLFFPEKESLLDLVDHFRAKTGKYAIKGYPHKLGLLLYGPPGTGKTSLIKALAQYTGRSIVNVPLSRVNTNSELMSVFFDQRYNVDGSYAPVKLGFRDVIYVMEDCDAASNVVKRRDGLMAGGTDVFTPERVVLPTPKSWWRLFLESQSSECQELVEELISASERLSQAADEMRPQILLGIASRLNDHPGLGLADEAASDPQVADVFGDAVETATERKDQQSKLDDILVSHAVAIKKILDAGVTVSEEFEEKLLGKQKAVIRSPVSNKIGLAQQEAMMAESLAAFVNNAAPAQGPPTGTGTSSWFKKNPDALSLSGLLNVLDGVIDTPGRIVIMTSNCPDMLDPALIRPGRVDKQLMLGYMGPEDVASMLEHYFQTALTDKQLRRVVLAVGRTSTRKFTPAEVEQMASEYDDLEDMLLALEKADGW